MLAARLEAGVRDPIHFFAFVVDEPDDAASTRELAIVAQREPANGAWRNDAVQDRCVAIAIEQPPATDGDRFEAVIPDRDMLDSGLLVVGMDKGRDEVDRVMVVIPKCLSLITVLGMRSRLATVIGVPRLGLERKEDR